MSELAGAMRHVDDGPVANLSAPDPIDLVADIAPTPILLIHGRFDVLVPLSDQDRLLDRAEAPKEGLRISFGGHDHSLLNAANARQIEDWVERQLPA